MERLLHYYSPDLHNSPQEGIPVVAIGDRLHQSLLVGLEQFRQLPHLLPHEQEVQEAIQDSVQVRPV